MGEGARPVAPSWLNKVQFILYYAFNACDAPFLLYVEYARAPAKRTALIFLGVDLFDIVKEYFRPRGLRSKRHGRHGRKNRKWRGVPEIADMVADALPGKYIFTERVYVWGTRVLYVIGDAYERAVWNLMLVSMATDFVYDTIDGVLRHENNNCGTINRALRQGTWEVIGGAGAFWKVQGVGELKYKHGIQSPNAFEFWIPAGTYIIVWALTVKIQTNHDARIGMRIRKNAATDTTIEQYGPIHHSPGDVFDIIVETKVEGPINVYFESASPDGFNDILKQDCQVLQIGN